MTTTTLAVVALAMSLDLLVGEPRDSAHPVAWFGRVVEPLDREWSVSTPAERAIGVLVALSLPLAAAVVAALLVVAAGALHPAGTPIAAGVVLFLSTSLRSLLERVSAVVAASEDDVEHAREAVRGLVGRDASDLSPGELRSAAVESAAENVVDGFVATLVPFALLAPISLPLAAAVAVWIKAVNTLDSMLGYPTKPVGTASARLDDAVMWLPARLGAFLIATAAGRPRAIVGARRWAGATPSPNSGWPMAVLACALGVRLEKPGVYVLDPDGHLPTVADGDRAVTIVGLAAVLAVVLAVIGAVYVGQLVEGAATAAAAVTAVRTPRPGPRPGRTAPPEVDP